MPKIDYVICERPLRVLCGGEFDRFARSSIFGFLRFCSPTSKVAIRVANCRITQGGRI